MHIVKNPFYDPFRCIAQNCPDSCCKEWSVQVDDASAARYRSLPGSLGDRLRQVLIREDGEFVIAIEDGRCPMWRSDGLCRIQAELGEQALCETCRAFPRLTHDYGDFAELTLELSCPEVSRLLLTQEWGESLVETIPGGEAPEYDTDAMAVLLRTRRQAMEILRSDRPVGEMLTLLLLYAYQAQGELDGCEETAFDADAALETAKALAKPADFADVLEFYAHLEILTDAWARRLEDAQPAPWSEHLRRLARYGVERYWLQAVSDYDLAGRVKMVVLSCLLVKNLGGDPVQTAQQYSKEIENNADNLDGILDAAYSHPAFTDDKLLGYLL